MALPEGIRRQSLEVDGCWQMPWHFVGLGRRQPQLLVIDAPLLLEFVDGLLVLVVKTIEGSLC